MKKIVILICLFFTTPLLAASNCNNSAFNIVNDSDETLIIRNIKSMVYTWQDDYLDAHFYNEGRLRNITSGQLIHPHSKITAYAYATSTSGGDIKAEIIIGGHKGTLSIDAGFNSFLWGFGNCTPKIEAYSSEYHVRISKIAGAPANATVTIY